ncbi:uncharacterized protein LOC143351674 [Colletes latitarsis]|uniref:uncharacterized protein LOC143351674 n=1 Tax=Colletes latitarsis TaxID=2605962 RepID=UPI004035FC2E
MNRDSRVSAYMDRSICRCSRAKNDPNISSTYLHMDPGTSWMTSLLIPASQPRRAGASILQLTEDHRFRALWKHEKQREGQSFSSKNQSLESAWACEDQRSMGPGKGSDDRRVEGLRREGNGRAFCPRKGRRGRRAARATEA